MSEIETNLKRRYNQSDKKDWIGGYNTTQKDLTEYERAILRERIEHVHVSRANASGKLHLCNAEGDGPLCPSNPERGITRPIETYPPGFKEWCQYCIGHFREGDL